MDQTFDPESVTAFPAQVEGWIAHDVLAWPTLIQAVLVLLALLTAWPLGRVLERGVVRLIAHPFVQGRLVGAVAALRPLALSCVWVLLLWLSFEIARAEGWDNGLLHAAATLLTAWIVIRYVASLIRDPGWSMFIAIAAWTVAALDILGLLTPVAGFLDSIGISIGAVRFSALTVIRGLIALAVLLWAAVALSGAIERRLSVGTMLTPSLQVLFGKLTRVALITLAIVAAVGSVGIDLTGFAVFTGALGVGIGFGLQKVVSNLISGVILLLDRSVKPGDVIAIGDTYGWVNSMGARFVALVTRDGIEHLIPNEDLITQRVENWSYSDTIIRLHCRVRVGYDCDLRRALSLLMEAARDTERVLANPAPNALVMGFGDSSIDLELRFWIRDPQNGTANVRSEVYLRSWDKFRSAGVVIPFPQLDLHIKSRS